MTCQELNQILQMYVDGFTDEEETRLAEEHLAGCAACREEVAGWRGAALALESLSPLTAPAGFADRIMARVAQEPVPATVGAAHGSAAYAGHRDGDRPAWPLQVSWSWAAAAVLMIGMGLTLWLGPEGSAAANAARGFLQLLGRLLHG